MIDVISIAEIGEKDENIKVNDEFLSKCKDLGNDIASFYEHSLKD